MQDSINSVYESHTISLSAGLAANSTETQVKEPEIRVRETVVPLTLKVKSNWKPRKITDKTITEDQNKFVRDLVEKYKVKEPRGNYVPQSWSFSESWPVETDLLSVYNI